MASQFAWNHFHTVNNEWLKLIKTFDLTYLSGLKQTRKVDLGDPGSSHCCKKENNNNNNNNYQLCFTRVTHNSQTTDKSGPRIPDRIGIEMLIFVEGGKPENPEQNPWSKDKNQQQTQPTYDTGFTN